MDQDPLLAHWDEVDVVFRAALDLPEAQRPGYVRRVATSTVAAIVLELLASQRHAGAFLDEGCIAIGCAPDPVSHDGAETIPPPEDSHAGPYRLLEEIGRGGSGSVYRARRTDGVFEQSVAVKILRRGLDTDDVLARFRAERQILASLTHPNIARLLDGGATRDHRPYLVVELIDGEPITDYCDRRRLTIDQRLRLFSDAARAVQYAHEHLVVHRDLKPSNILVTTDGHVKLLDFGIAKMLDAEAFPVETPRTRPGVRVMTPEYASPEQRCGGPVGIASDVYQLGILLYQLLTGTRPFVSDRPIDRMAQAHPISPASPSVAFDRTPADARHSIARQRHSDPRRLRSSLRGDLDTIVSMALRQEPERRYANVAALLADIDRHRTGLPVHARPATWSYRIRKLLVRHPWAATAACALVVGAAGYVQTLRIHSLRLEKERNLAEVQRQQAEESRAHASARELEAAFERDRADVARIRAEEAVHTAEEERRRAERESGRTRSALERAELERDRAERVSKFMIDMFRVSAPTAAKTNELTARELVDHGAERALAGLRDQPEVRASLLSTLAGIYATLGAADRAENLLKEALTSLRVLRGVHHRDVGLALRTLGLHYFRNRDFRSAEPLLQESVAIQRAQPVVDWWGVVGTMGELANVRRELGDLDGAEVLLEDALALHRARPGSLRVSTTLLTEMALVHRAKGQWQQAEAVYREQLRQLRQNERPTLELSSVMNNLAFVLEQQNDHDGAEPLYREALAIVKLALGEAHRTTSTVTTNLASVLASLRRYEEADALLQERIAVEKRHNPAAHWKIGLAHGVLAASLAEQGRHAAAEPHLREQISIYTAGLGADHGWTATARSKLGRSLIAQGRYGEAEDLLRPALAAVGAEQDEQRVQGRADLRAALVELYESLGRLDEAERYRDASATRR